MIWEYKVVTGETGTSQLNEFGSEGWELVAATDSFLFFKRPTALDGRDAFTHFYNREKSYD